MPKHLGRVGEVEVAADLVATTRRTEALLVASSCG